MRADEDRCILSLGLRISGSYDMIESAGDPIMELSDCFAGGRRDERRGVFRVYF